MRRDSIFLTVDASICIENSYLFKSTYNCCSMLFFMLLYSFNCSAITCFIRFSPIVCVLAVFAIKSEIEYDKRNPFCRLILGLYKKIVIVVILFTIPSKYVPMSHISQVVQLFSFITLYSFFQLFHRIGYFLHLVIYLFIRKFSSIRL